VLYVTYRIVSLQNIKPNTNFAVIFMIFEAEICVFSHPVTFVSFGFSRLCIYGLLTLSLAQTVEHRILRVIKEQNIERLRKEGDILRYYLTFSSRDSRNLHKSRTRTQT